MIIMDDLIHINWETSKIMMMWHFSRPKKHVLLHLEKKLCRPELLKHCFVTHLTFYEITAVLRIWILPLVIL